MTALLIPMRWMLAERDFRRCSLSSFANTTPDKHKQPPHKNKWIRNSETKFKQQRNPVFSSWWYIFSFQFFFFLSSFFSFEGNSQSLERDYNFLIECNTIASTHTIYKVKERISSAPTQTYPGSNPYTEPNQIQSTKWDIIIDIAVPVAYSTLAPTSFPPLLSWLVGDPSE